MRGSNRTAENRLALMFGMFHTSAFIHYKTVITIIAVNPQVHLEEDSFYLLSLSQYVGKELTEQYNFSRAQQHSVIQQDLYRDSWMTSLEESIRLYIFK